MEDEALSRRTLAQMLEADFTVTMAASGRQGLSRAQSQPPPDLILLDIMLPDIDGFAVMERLRGDPATCRIPVIVITALESACDEARGLNLGAIDYITKPYHPTLAKARIRNHLAMTATNRLLSPDPTVTAGAHADLLLRADLRAPIAAMFSTAQYLLHNSNLDQSARTLIEGIAAASQKLLVRIGNEDGAFHTAASAIEVPSESEAAPPVPTGIVAGGEARQRILVVDDDKTGRQFLAEIFQQTYDVLLAKNGEQALVQAARIPQPDLILLDVVMPDMDGYEVLRRLKSDARTLGIPVIFVTGLSREDDEAKGLDLGVVDYITKPYNPSIIRARVQNHLKFVGQRRLLENLATIDFLTGLANRRRFNEALDQEWRRTRRSGEPLSVVMVDVDCFKAFNDTYGHLSGDEVLRKVAHAIARPLRRPYDLAARYGGEEFVLLLPQTGADEAWRIAEKIRTEVETLGIGHEASPVAAVVTVSVGIGTVEAGAECRPEALLGLADTALYRAKNGGRNRVERDAG